MSADNALIARYLRAIVKDDAEIKSLLKFARSRGILAAVSTTCFAGEDPEGCCDEGDSTGSTVPDENAGTIDGERPDDGENEKGMDGTYRNPAGDIVDWDDPEMDCVPDDDFWEQSYYWHIDTLYCGMTFAATPKLALIKSCFVNADDPFSPLDVRFQPDDSEAGYDPLIIELLARSGDWRVYVGGGAVKNFCGESASDYCQLIEPPCIREYWPIDGKCQEALINGKFIPAPNDPDCASRAPRDFQTMCQDGSCITYIPTSDGGHMRVNVDPVTRLPDSNSITSYYDSDGKFQREESYRKRNVEAAAYSENNVPGNWE